MNTVPFSPVFPDIPAVSYLGESKNLGESKIQQLLKLMKEPEVNSLFQVYVQNIVDKLLPTAVEKVLADPDSPILRLAVENVLATSDLRVLKRLAVLETDLGHNDLDFEDEDRVPTVPEQLSILAERIETITAAMNKPVKKITKEQVINPKTTLEHKAVELVEHLKTKVNPRNGEVFLNSREIITVLKHEIPEEYRLKDIQNPRQAKKDIIEKAKKLFSDFIVLDRKKHGNRDVRIVYKPKNDILNMKRMGTYIHL